MSTTPLPPLPTPWIHDLSAAEGSQQHFAADQMQTYAQQARADLEAENARLREALATLQMQCNSLAASNWREWQELSSLQEFERWAKSRAVHMEALARAALEKQP